MDKAAILRQIRKKSDTFTMPFGGVFDLANMVNAQRRNKAFMFANIYADKNVFCGNILISPSCGTGFCPVNCSRRTRRAVAASLQNVENLHKGGAARNYPCSTGTCCMGTCYQKIITQGWVLAPTISFWAAPIPAPRRWYLAWKVAPDWHRKYA